MAAGHIPRMMYDLSKVGFKPVPESIIAITTCILLAQLAACATIVVSTAGTLNIQAEFLKALESYIMRHIKDFSADITRYQNILSNANSTLNFAIAPGFNLIPSDLSLKTDPMREYNNALLQAPPSAFELVANIKGIKKRDVGPVIPDPGDKKPDTGD